MKKEEFEFLLQQGEGLRLEFKEGFESKSLARELVAFANTEGGKVIIGVNDKKELVGTTITSKLKSEVQDLARNCDPSIKIKIEELNNVLIIEVDEGLNKPYRCSEGFYLRQGSNSQKLSTNEIREFFNKEGKILFDDAINHAFSFENGFNKSKFEEFSKRANLSRTIEDKDILKNLGVITEDSKFKNAGVLFFCDEVEKFFRHAIITCVLYKGVNKTFIIDRKDFHSDIYSNYNDTMNFLRKNLKLIYRIEGAGPRKEILEIPEEALKEVVINAIAHRDYNEKGANIQIDLFDDRVVISNPGGLIIKGDEFGKISRTRNPLIFNLLQRIDLVEKVGSGIERIRNAMAKLGLKEPKFNSGEFFSVALFKPSDEQISMMSGAKTAKTGGQESGQESGQDLTERQKEILNLIRKNNLITREELSDKVGINQSAVQKHIENLKEKGIIKRIGPDKGGHWEVLKS